MNEIQETTSTHPQTASTERKLGRGRKVQGTRAATALRDEPVTTTQAIESDTAGAATMNTQANDSGILNATTQAKFVLFSISRADRVANGPLMRGFIEIKGEGDAEPDKVHVAAWHKIARQSGVEYLSLKVGNNTAQDPDDYDVGPFYGRLFRKADGNRSRYFGYIENSEKTGEDANGQGLYATHWQISVNAKPAVSNDGKTRYISGAVNPAQQVESTEESELPF